jgi:hypothetical protein
MKKLYLSLVAATMASTAMFAQNTLVATLTHGENVTMYYGTYALRDAHEAAVSGDVINLSGGGFQAVDITKALALRGTGIDETVSTSIVGGFTINIPSTDTGRFSMEGIRCQGYITMTGTFDNPYFIKSQFGSLGFETVASEPTIKNAMFVNCKITGDRFYLNGTSSVQFVNSYVSGFQNVSEATSSASFVNCIVRPREGVNAGDLRSCQLMNCILYNNHMWYGSTSLPSTTIASNCVAINDNGRMSGLFDNSQTNPNCGYAVYSEMFKDFTGEYSDSQTFELSEEGKKRQLGTDGSEIGLYGGLMPYTSIPSYPRITKMNVANKTTADGKLSVEIEVSAAQ